MEYSERVLKHFSLEFISDEYLLLTDFTPQDLIDITIPVAPVNSTPQQYRAPGYNIRRPKADKAYDTYLKNIGYKPPKKFKIKD